MSAAPGGLQTALEAAFAGLGRVRDAFAPQLAPREIGIITSVSTGIARISGLPGVGAAFVI